MLFAKVITCFVCILLLNNCLESYFLRSNLRSNDLENDKIFGILSQNYCKYLSKSDEKQVSEFERQEILLKLKKFKV